MSNFLQPYGETIKRLPAISKRVVSGPIVDEIVNAAEDLPADLIVMSPRRPAISVPHLTHDLIDQLSIIKLSCFKIDHTFSIDPKKNPTKDFEAIDNAVREITMLIEQFSNCLPNPKRPGRAIAVTHNISVPYLPISRRLEE